jgi:Zn-dependent peptidase ImmA (M78 family)
VTVLKILQSSPEGQELLRKMNSRADESSEARAVNRYAAAISMPKALLREEALKIDRTKWPNLYRLAEKFVVSITALKVRLEQLDLLRIGSDSVLYDSPDKAVGQGSLNL